MTKTSLISVSQVEFFYLRGGFALAHYFSCLFKYTQIHPNRVPRFLKTSFNMFYLEFYYFILLILSGCYYTSNTQSCINLNIRQLVCLVPFLKDFLIHGKLNFTFISSHLEEFLKIQRRTPVYGSLFLKSCRRTTCNFINKETPAQVFFFEFPKFSKTIFL